MSETFRAEIISNQSVQDDITELLEQNIKDIQYTVIPEIHGCGLSSKKLGDTIWPEQNFVLFTYVSREEAQTVKSVVEAVKAKFPKEGISLFFVKAEEI